MSDKVYEATPIKEHPPLFYAAILVLVVLASFLLGRSSVKPQVLQVTIGQPCEEASSGVIIPWVSSAESPAPSPTPDPIWTPQPRFGVR